MAGLAAMEPGLEDQEDAALSAVIMRESGLPQWSLALKIRKTWNVVQAVTSAVWPVKGQ